MTKNLQYIANSFILVVNFSKHLKFQIMQWQFSFVLLINQTPAKKSSSLITNVWKLILKTK